jgi:hypothetical protein
MAVIRTLLFHRLHWGLLSKLGRKNHKIAAKISCAMHLLLNPLEY